MDSIEALIAHIQAFSGSAKDLNHLQSLLNQADESLQPLSSRLAPFLEQLDPSTHSLGYLYLLEARTSGQILREQASDIILTVAKFINSCSAEQIHLAPEKFISVCRRFKEQLLLLQVPIQGIAPMRTAIRKLRPSSEHLTTLHPDFLLLCLLAKCYKAGLSILDEDIFEVDQPRDFFLYCYYGGMINIGQKRFRKALEYLHNAVTAPMTVLNAIAVEAYKKYVLVSLILTGQVPSFPKYTSSVAQRNLKSNAQPYVDLANSYGTGKMSELESCLETNMEKFKTDSNLGLVRQVLSSLYKRNIQRLTQTYLTLSLQDIANTVQLENSKQAEMHVLQMIQDGEIFATINQKDGMVSFHEDPEQYKTCEMIEHIDGSIQRIMTLSKKLSSMDELISYDPTYLAKAGRERSRFDIDDFDSVPQKFM
ncbi:COP9 signalosome complex subunit 3 [Magnolia sinica]|uniref:COP9 signalosome complex subunit 3 n=1 Tax=Magnolia sinica TaxID=86752 RepID=UPI0026595FC6|nr:COP9 signalosome complex subunit 3 [Magnolia sinica]